VVPIRRVLIHITPNLFAGFFIILIKSNSRCYSFDERSAGFTYRLYRLKPRASKSKGASKKCGTHRVNGRYV